MQSLLIRNTPKLQTAKGTNIQTERHIIEVQILSSDILKIDNFVTRILCLIMLSSQYQGAAVRQDPMQG